tara:strand:+ start:249 stop:485 length:237 start_codon:yes stop_codon:yes gene_type:complete
MTTETPFAQRRREAHVIIRALDSVIWADDLDEQAAIRVVNKLWHTGKLAGIILPDQIVDYLTRVHRKQYERGIEESAA